MLSVDEKICIVHKVLVGFEHQQEVAKRYRISPSHVARLVCKARKKPEFVRELWNRRAAKEEKERTAEAGIMELVKSGQFIANSRSTASRPI